MKKLFALMLSAALCLSLLAACSSKQPDDNGGSDVQEPVDLAAFAQEALKNHDMADYLDRLDPDDAEFGSLMLENSYPGLKDLELEQTEIYMAMISFSSGELALVQAKDADGAAKAKEIFQARIDAKSTEGAGNYPEEVEIWQRNAKLVDNGNYVMMVCHEDSAAIVDEFNALFK